MKKKITYSIIVILLCSFCSASLAQENIKLAQSGFKFLNVVSDARAAAMADAMTSLQIGSRALFFNPAGMSLVDRFLDVTASRNDWIADITHYTFSFSIRPFNGNYGVLGISLQNVNYGDFYGTRVNKAIPEGYEDTGIFSLNAFAVGVGYAKQLTDRFSVGGHVRWVHQDLGQSMIATNIRPSTTDTLHEHRAADTVFVNNKLSPFVFDFGTQFRTGIKSLVFGMSIRNFSGEVKYAEEGFQAPLTFTLGISMDLMDIIGESPMKQSLYMSVDASHYRDHPEQLKIGLDYKIMNTFSLRAGYKTNSDEDGWSFGIGFSKYGFDFDYAMTSFGVFNNVQRFTAGFRVE